MADGETDPVAIADLFPVVDKCRRYDNERMHWTCQHQCAHHYSFPKSHVSRQVPPTLIVDGARDTSVVVTLVTVEFVGKQFSNVGIF